MDPWATGLIEFAEDEESAAAPEIDAWAEGLITFEEAIAERNKRDPTSGFGLSPRVDLNFDERAPISIGPPATSTPSGPFQPGPGVPEPWVQQEGLSTPEGRLNAAKSVAHGIVRLGASIPKDIAILAGEITNLLPKWVPGKDVPIEESLHWKAAKKLEEAVEKWLPRDPKYRDDFLAQQLPEAAGNLLVFVAGGGLSKLLRLPAAAAPVVLGAGAQASATYEEARAFGLDEKDSLTLARLGGALGTTEAVPIFRAFGRFDRATGGTFKKTLSGVLKSAALGSVEEAIQETFSRLGENQLANAYDSEREWAEGIVASGGAGGILGFTANLILTGAGVGRHKLRQRRLQGHMSEAATLEAAEALVKDDPTLAKKVAKAEPSRKKMGELLPGMEESSASDRKRVQTAVKTAIETEKAIDEAGEPVQVRIPEPRIEAEMGAAVQAVATRRGIGIPVAISAEAAPAYGPAQARVAHLRPIAMPEMVELAQTVMGGTFPKIRKLKGEVLGLFKSVEGEPLAAIKINPRAAQDEQLLGQVLAHEIGHLTDFLPEMTLKRGTIVGRIAGLRRYMKRYRESIGGKPELVEDEIRRELIKLSEWWTPYDKEGASQSYKRYRESSRELYAQALSVLLNAPSEVATRAPEFYRGFLEYLEAKPHMMNEFLDLQNMLSGEPSVLGIHREDQLHKMWANTEQAISGQEQAGKASTKSIIQSAVQAIHQYVMDTKKPAKVAVAGRWRTGFNKEFDEGANAAAILDELFLPDNDNHLWLTAIQRNVHAPALAAGLNINDFGDYLLLRRVVTERAELANPLGWTPSAAKQQIEHLQNRLGPERYAALERAMQRLHDMFFTLAERARDAGYYSKEAFAEKIEPNKDNYAAFAVLKYFEGKVPAGLYKQVGTFEEIANPYLALALKGVSLNRAIQLNNAKRMMWDRMDELMPGAIGDVDVPFGRHEPKRAPKGYTNVAWFDDGKLKWKQVPDAIGKFAWSHDIGGIMATAQLMNSAVYRTFHPLFVTYSPGFLIGNPQRDFWRTWHNLSPIGGALAKRVRRKLESEGMTAAEAKEAAKKQNISLGQLTWAVLTAIPSARRRALGISDEFVDTLLRERALAIRYTEVRAETNELLGAETVARTIKGQRPKNRVTDWAQSRNIAKQVIGKSLAAIRTVNEIVEGATKIGAARLLGERGVTGPERAMIVRKYVGTPDYMQKGLATPITNSLWMYQKVRLNGFFADMDLATNPATAYGWWWRRMVRTLMPMTFTKLAVYGAFGAYLQSLMRNIPYYFHEAYDVIPLGLIEDEKDKEEKTLFLSLRKDDMGFLLSRLWSRALDAALKQAGAESPYPRWRQIVGDVLGDAWGSTVGDWNPVIQTSTAWGQYMLGRNPHDAYFGTTVVPRREWEAGGWYAGRKMLAWTMDKGGAISDVAHFATGPLVGSPFEPGVDNTTETKVRSVPGLNRILRISNRGKDAFTWAKLENDEIERARFRLRLPPNAHDASTERYFLNRRRTIDALDQKKRIRRLALNDWYNLYYLPLTEQIRDAEDAEQRSEANRFREELQEHSANIGTTEAYAVTFAHRVAKIRPDPIKKPESYEKWQQDRNDATEWFKQSQVPLDKARGAYQMYLHKRYKTEKTRASYLRRFDASILR